MEILNVLVLYITLYFDCVSDLGRMYMLVSRIVDGLGELKTLLETHIYTQGQAAIERCGEAALNVSKLFIIHLLELGSVLPR